MARGLGSRRGDDDKEYEVEDVKSPHNSRLELVGRLPPLRRRHSLLHGANDGEGHGRIVHPDNKLYRLWTRFIVVWAVYSTFVTPFEFGFFRGLPRKLFFLDIVGQIAFLTDIVLKFFVAYRDPDTYRIVCNPTSIALRYCKSSFIFDLLGCFPWDAIYKVILLLSCNFTD